MQLQYSHARPKKICVLLYCFLIMALKRSIELCVSWQKNLSLLVPTLCSILDYTYKSGKPEHYSVCICMYSSFTYCVCYLFILYFCECYFVTIFHRRLLIHDCWYPLSLWKLKNESTNNLFMRDNVSYSHVLYVCTLYALLHVCVAWLLLCMFSFYYILLYTDYHCCYLFHHHLLTPFLLS